MTLYRTLLSKAPAKSVTIASIGFFDSLYLLFDSKPDAISPLTGLELIKEKVTELVVQAAGTGTSYNIARHNPLYPTHVLNQWPTKLTFVPGFIGSTVWWGDRLTTELDLQKNPVAWAFNTTIGYNKKHQSWDREFPIRTPSHPQVYLWINSYGDILRRQGPRRRLCLQQNRRKRLLHAQWNGHLERQRHSRCAAELG